MVDFEYGSIGSHSNVTNVFVGSASVDAAECVDGDLELVINIVKSVTLVFDAALGLNEGIRYKSTHKVWNSELVEVPQDLKETIVKDII